MGYLYGANTLKILHFSPVGMVYPECLKTLGINDAITNFYEHSTCEECLEKLRQRGKLDARNRIYSERNL